MGAKSAKKCASIYGPYIQEVGTRLERLLVKCRLRTGKGLGLVLGFMLRVRVRVRVRIKIKVRVRSSILPYCWSAGPVRRSAVRI